MKSTYIHILNIHSNTRVYITMIFGRLVVKVLLESKMSPKLNHLFCGPLSTFPENLLNKQKKPLNLLIFGHITAVEVITDLIFDKSVFWRL